MEEQKSSLRWLFLSLLFLMNATGFCSINCLPPLFIEISEQVAMSKAQFGSIMGVVLLSSLIFAPIGGGISDKIGSRLAGGLGVLVAGVAAFMRAYMESVTGFMICNLFIGAGLAFFAPNMPKVLGTWFPRKELALANGICTAALGIGGAIAMAISASVLSPAFGGWQGALKVIGGAVILMSVLWIFLYRDGKTGEVQEKKKQSMGKNFKNVLKVKDLKLIMFYRAFNMVGYMALIVFLPSILQERGIAQAGQYVSIMMTVVVIFNVLGPGVSDRVGLRKPFLLVSTVVLGLSILTFSTLSGVPLMIALIIAGAAMGTLAPIVFILPVEFKEIGPGLAATAVGIILMIGNTCGFLGPMIVGKLIDLTGSNVTGFIFMATACTSAAIFIFPLTETGRRKRLGDR
jgi:cyanate permease